MSGPVDPRRARVFGTFAADYDRWRPSYPEEAVRWLVPDNARLVADVGAGTGKLTGVLVRLGVEVVAVEPDPDMLDVLRANHPHVQLANAPAEALPLADGGVDAVLVGQAWHWFDHQRAVAEVRRVLRPGGWLGIIGNEAGPREPWLDELAALHPDVVGTDDATDDGANPWAEQGLAGVPFAARLFPWQHMMTPAALKSLLATHSVFAVMPEAEREARLGQMAAVAQAEADRRGVSELPFHQVASCVRVFV
ncbi:Methyltransferase domain-containing protein [Nakamurella panacisegetis]|uniref:Methyltransferase domain-containing protein n=1 Tax=Nakamurella panacisegetis TaxID=1090615 RepID=A0A1H0MFF1_9ACTN|nr:class I SAM-dependent methyltransferase [Nakamurella panacisegetis]SDO79107.1 Methyltransferase domain-containing protein [Nakamurella panacisegetis]